jgi:hypothetical protein
MGLFGDRRILLAAFLSRYRLGELIIYSDLDPDVHAYYASLLLAK